MNDPHDPELERLLRRYRPIDPPARLRGRILSPPGSLRIWPWATAAAVLLVSVLTLKMAAQREASRIDLGADPPIAVVADLAEALGGDAVAQALAESIVRETQRRSDLGELAREPEGDQP